MLFIGFDTCIKANLPLVNRLIKTLSWMPNHASIGHHFISHKLVLSFQISKEY